MSDSNSTTTEQYVGVWACRAAGEAAPLAPGASISLHPPLDMDAGVRQLETQVCAYAQASLRMSVCIHCPWKWECELRF